MGTEQEPLAGDGAERNNYFNYFTETEEHFQSARGTSLFLLSPLDWALLESWKNSGVPLRAVLRGIDVAFEKWRARRIKTQTVNSLAFCAQAVMTEAQRAPDEPSQSGGAAEQPFAPEEVRAYLRSNAVQLRTDPALTQVAEALEKLADEDCRDLEELEKQLTVLEAKVIATLRVRQTQESAMSARRELDTQLQPYRRKMTAAHLAMLEQQFLDRKLLEELSLPRLSLFYLR